MMSRTATDFISAVFILGFSLCMFLGTTSLEKRTRFFPSFILLCLAILCTFLLIKKGKELWQSRGKAELVEEVRPPCLRAFLSPILIIAFCVLFLLTLEKTGFELCGFALIFGIMLSINPREALRKVYYAVLVPIVLVLIFYYGLGLRLPSLLQIF